MLLAAAAHVGCAAGELLHVGDKDREDAAACAAAGCAWLRVAQDGNGIAVERLIAVLEGRERPELLPRGNGE
jgi:FMN phosphatase YigB (HAD superfamily)